MLAQYYQFLHKYLSFQTVSESVNSDDIFKKCSQWIKDEFSKNSIQTKIVEWYGNPIVLWYYQSNKHAPTCLLYGHYDVVPADKSDAWWKHNPFSLYIGKDKIIARGVSGNKWQTAVHLQTIFDLIKKDVLWYNLIILLEGDYYHASSGFSDFLQKYKDSLQADFALMSVGESLTSMPMITIGFRWWFHAQLTLKTATTAIDVAGYGWVVPNAIHETNKLLSKLFDSWNHVTLPYFYYDVDDISFEEKQLLKESEEYLDQKHFEEVFWVRGLVKEKEFSVAEQLWLRPTVQVTNISSVQWFSSWNNSIAHKVRTDIDVRLVGQQDPSKIARSFEWWIKANIPAYVDYVFDTYGLFSPIKVNIDHALIEKTKNILESQYWKKVLFNYSGWWLPAVKLFEDILWIPSVVVPFANNDSHVCWVNENLDIDVIQKAMNFSQEFFQS